MLEFRLPARHPGERGSKNPPHGGFFVDSVRSRCGLVVAPAQAGAQVRRYGTASTWIPASAGMTHPFPIAGTYVPALGRRPPAPVLVRECQCIASPAYAPTRSDPQLRWGPLPRFGALHPLDQCLAEARARHLCRSRHQPGEVVGHNFVRDRLFQALDDQLGGLFPTHVHQHHLG